jgi:hypothetical protein
MIDNGMVVGECVFVKEIKTEHVRFNTFAVQR